MKGLSCLIQPAKDSGGTNEESHNGMKRDQYVFRFSN